MRSTILTIALLLLASITYSQTATIEKSQAEMIYDTIPSVAPCTYCSEMIFVMADTSEYRWDGDSWELWDNGVRWSLEQDSIRVGYKFGIEYARDTIRTHGSEGGGGGTVNAVVAGDNVSVDNTDPANPIVSVPSIPQEDVTIADPGGYFFASDLQGMIQENGLSIFGLEQTTTATEQALGIGPLDTNMGSYAGSTLSDGSTQVSLNQQIENVLEVKMDSFTLVMAADTSYYVFTQYNTSTGAFQVDTLWQRAVSGGGVSGGGVANHVAIWDGGNSIDYDNNELYWDFTNHRLGLGTSTPSYKLDLLATSAPLALRHSITDLTSGLDLINNDVSANSVNSIRAIFSNNSNATQDVGGYISFGKSQLWTGAGGTKNSYLSFGLSQNGSPFEVFRMNSNGNFGINTASPNAKLDIVGDQRISGASGSLIFKDDASSLYSANATFSLALSARLDNAQISTYNNLILEMVNNGNVGISTSSPSYLLDLGGAKAAIRLTPHDNTLVNTEGLLFADDSENRLKYYDGTTLQQLAFISDITGGGTMSSFNLESDDFTIYSIEDGDDVSLLGENGIATRDGALPGEVKFGLELDLIPVNASLNGDEYFLHFDVLDGIEYQSHIDSLREYILDGVPAPATIYNPSGLLPDFGTYVNSDGAGFEITADAIDIQGVNVTVNGTPISIRTQDTLFIPIYAHPHDEAITTGSSDYRGWRVPADLNGAKIEAIQYSFDTPGSDTVTIQMTNGTINIAGATIPALGYVENTAVSQTLTTGEKWTPTIGTINGTGHEGLMVNLMIVR